MATREQIKQKLIIALITEIKLIDKALVDNVMQSNIEITDIIFIDPKIVLPEGIDKDDFEKAEKIDFVNAHIRVSKDDISLLYYCNGNSDVVYENNEFSVDLKIYSIKSNL